MPKNREAEVEDMNRIQSIDDFGMLSSRLHGDRDMKIPTIVISAGTCGQACGANDLIRIVKREIISNGLLGKVGLRVTGCHGFCQIEPLMLI